MATIDSLHFEVILDDKKFDEKIKADLKLAQSLNTEMSRILDLKNKLNKETTEQAINLEKVKQAQQKTAQEAAKTTEQQQKAALATKKTEEAQEKVTSKVYQTRTALSSTEKVIRTISQLTGVAFSVVGLRRFLSSLIEITGQFEVQRMALRNMLQDIDGADKIFQDLYRFSSDSTYRFSELAKYAKQLAAFNIDKSDLLETTKMLGDVASGVGVSMDRIILAYGHVKSSGFLRGIQLRSFSQNGVPVLEELSKMLTEIEGKTVSLGDVFDKMTKREIPFEMVEQAFKNMTSEGGKFYQMQEVLAKTLAGQINILKGRWENMLAAVGQSQDGILKGAVGKISNLVADYTRFGEVLKEVIAVIGVYRAGIVLTTLATEGLSAATNIGLLGAFKNVLKWIASNPYAILAASITYVTYEIVKATQALNEQERIQKAITDVTDKYNKSLGDEIAEMDALFAAVKNATYGTEEFDVARRALENRFDPYIQKLREEGVTIDNLADLYDGLAKKITEANKQRFLETAQHDILDAYHDVTDEINKDFEKLLGTTMGLTPDQIGAMRHYVNTGIKNEIYGTIPGLDKGRRRTMALAGGGTTSWEEEETLQDKLDKLMERMTGAADVYAQGMADAVKKFDVATEQSTGNAKQELEGWRATATKAIDSIDEKFKKNLNPKEDEDYFEYLERIGKHYKEVNEYKDKALQKDKQIYQSELDAIKKIDTALEGNILSDERYTKTPWKGSESAPQLTPLEKAWVAMMEETEDWLEKDLNKKLEQNTKELEKNLDKREKAATDYDKFFKDWSSTDFGKKGTGALFKVSSAVTEYNNKNDEADKKYAKGLSLLQTKHKGNAEAIEREAKALRDVRDQQKELNKTEFREKVRGLADDIFKEGMQGFDLTNWADKSLTQINKIREALSKMDVPPEIRKELESDSELLQLLIDELKRLSQSTITNTVDPERFKKVAKESKRIAGYLGNMADKLKELSVATDNSNLSDLAYGLGMLAQNMQAAAEGAEAWGGWWGAIIGGVTDFIDQFSTGMIGAVSAAKELSKTLKQVQTDARIGGLRSLFSGDGIFGENSVSNIRGASYAIQQLRDDMASLGDPEVKRAVDFWEKVRLIWKVSLKPGEITDYEFISQGKLSEVLEKYGLNAFDKYGNFDAESVREIIKLFGDESGVLELIAKNSEAFAESMKLVEDAMESLFGDIASSAAETIVDSWIEAGNAALDYADILDDVARAYSKMLIQSVIMETALDPITDDLKEAFIQGRYGDAMEMVAGAMQAIQDATPMYEEILNTFDPYFNRSGSGSSSNSLGNGIKSITEDTANLLASYLNAIRADVSYMRSMQEKGWETITAFGASLPTLNDYIAQIAATNFDIAQSNQSILSELRSVIGPSGTSGMVVRVERA